MRTLRGGQVAWTHGGGLGMLKFGAKFDYDQSICRSTTGLLGLFLTSGQSSLLRKPLKAASLRSSIGSMCASNLDEGITPQSVGYE